MPNCRSTSLGRLQWYWSRIWTWYDMGSWIQKILKI